MIEGGTAVIAVLSIAFLAVVVTMPASYTVAFAFGLNMIR